MSGPVAGKALRQQVLDCLHRPNVEDAIAALSGQVPHRRLLRPLLSFIRSDDLQLRHRAAAAMGYVTAIIAETDLEAARDVVRRLLLSLTEESGGIGWGSPEALGEILARHERLSVEFAHILLSYACIDEENYLDHEPLQRGVLWGLARLAQVRPDQLIQQGATTCLLPHLRSHDATIRALAARTVALLGIADESSPEWKAILEDSSEVRVYIEDRLVDCRVGDLVGGTLHTP